MGGNRTVGWDDVLAIFFDELRPDVGVQRRVKGLQLLPQAIDFGFEFVGGHIVLQLPDLSDVFEAKFASALVGQLHHAGVAIAHRSADSLPSGPGFFQLFGITAGSHQLADRSNVKAFSLWTVGTPGAFAVVSFERSFNSGKFLL